ncbi:ScbA/BarX family gamma-butyrolactone biosynthesis protein [Streptomyces sp. NPDC048275]|uniref:ScbA/BarX family gamma-butyrolactone biosynthesis protein n=1 Tax=Streptomyces sp. NPDC048275 TaxID=3155629 RepID=UPI00340EF279
MTAATGVATKALFDQSPSPPKAEPAPAFSRTIERELVHRAAVSEVFVTDLRPTGDGAFAAGAQLPLSHGYFADHLREPASYDFLLLLESARQACTAAGHLYLGVPRDTVFLVNDWSIRIDDLVPLTPGSRPGELHLTGTGERREGRGGRLRGVSYDVDLRLGEGPVGHVRINTSTSSAEDYQKLRFLQRRSTPPLTEELGTLVRSQAAADVGRNNPLNVVLGEPVHTKGAVSAQVEPRLDNRSLFDHSYDHVPAMVLAEAARQLAHLAGVPVTASVTDCAARYLRFVELDSPVVATGRPDANGPGFLVEFRQDGATVAETALTFAASVASAKEAS